MHGWAGRKFEAWLIDWPKVVWGLPDVYRTEDKAKMTPQFPTKSIKKIIEAKAQGWINKENYQLYHANSNVAGRKKLVIKTIICRTPRIMSQVIAVSYFGFKILSDREMRTENRFQLLECFDRVSVGSLPSLVSNVNPD